MHGGVYYKREKHGGTTPKGSRDAEKGKVNFERDERSFQKNSQPTNELISISRKNFPPIFQKPISKQKQMQNTQMRACPLLFLSGINRDFYEFSISA
jgi:hypothetical protein